MKLSKMVDFAEVMDLMLDAVCVVDRSSNIVFVSAAFEQIFGYKPSEVIGKSIAEYVLPQDNERTAITINKIIDGISQPSFENRWVHKSGRVVHVLWSARWSEKHQVRIAVAHDITERKQMEEQLKFLASHDSLTQLPNRLLLEERLKQSMSLAKRSKSNICLYFIDVDGFKQINDIHGHFVGDEVLKTLAQRLKLSVRESDSVGRMSGDEFLIILDNVALKEDVLSLAEKMLGDIEKPMVIDKLTLHLTISIGIAFYPDDADNEEQLIQMADQAMYKAKRAGGNQIFSLFQKPGV